MHSYGYAFPNSSHPLARPLPALQRNHKGVRQQFGEVTARENDQARWSDPKDLPTYAQARGPSPPLIGPAVVRLIFQLSILDARLHLELVTIEVVV